MHGFQSGNRTAERIQLRLRSIDVESLVGSTLIRHGLASARHDWIREHPVLRVVRAVDWNWSHGKSQTKRVRHVNRDGGGGPKADRLGEHGRAVDDALEESLSRRSARVIQAERGREGAVVA